MDSVTDPIWFTCCCGCYSFDTGGGVSGRDVGGNAFLLLLSLRVSLVVFRHVKLVAAAVALGGHPLLLLRVCDDSGISI